MRDPEEEAAFRVLRLEAFVKKHGSMAAAGRALGYENGTYIRQLLRRNRPINEKFIAKLEAESGCAGWFDVGRNAVAQPAAPSAPDSAAGLVSSFARLLQPLDAPTRNAIGASLAGLISDPDTADIVGAGIDAMLQVRRQPGPKPKPRKVST